MSCKESDDISIPKIGEELIHIQQRLFHEITEAVTKYKSNYNLKTPFTLCDIRDTDWILEEKITLIKKLFKIEKPAVSLPVISEKYLCVLDMLKRENEKQFEAIEILKQQIKIVKEEIQKDEVMLHLLQTKILGQEEFSTIEEIDAKSKVDFRIYKKYLHVILKQCSSNSTLENLIKDLTTAYLQEGDAKYLNISEYSFNDVQLLKEASLIIQDPNDKLKIKFIQ